MVIPQTGHRGAATSRGGTIRSHLWDGIHGPGPFASIRFHAMHDGLRNSHRPHGSSLTLHHTFLVVSLVLWLSTDDVSGRFWSGRALHRSPSVWGPKFNSHARARFIHAEIESRTTSVHEEPSLSPICDELQR